MTLPIGRGQHTATQRHFPGHRHDRLFPSARSTRDFPGWRTKMRPARRKCRWPTLPRRRTSSILMLGRRAHARRQYAYAMSIAGARLHSARRCRRSVERARHAADTQKKATCRRARQKDAARNARGPPRSSRYHWGSMPRRYFWHST